MIAIKIVVSCFILVFSCPKVIPIDRGFGGLQTKTEKRWKNEHSKKFFSVQKLWRNPSDTFLMKKKAPLPEPF
jgi:hypothetical protein